MHTKKKKLNSCQQCHEPVFICNSSYNRIHHNRLPCPMQSISAAIAVIRLQSWLGHHSHSGIQGRNLEFVPGACDASPTLREGRLECGESGEVQMGCNEVQVGCREEK